MKKNRNIEMKTAFIDQDYFRDVLDEVAECPFLHINLLLLMMNDFARIRNIKRKKLFMATCFRIQTSHIGEWRQQVSMDHFSGPGSVGNLKICVGPGQSLSVNIKVCWSQTEFFGYGLMVLVSPKIWVFPGLVPGFWSVDRWTKVYF